MRYCSKDYEGYLIDEDMEKRLAGEKHKKYDMFQDKDFREYYKKSRARKARYGTSVAMLWAALSIVYVALSIYGHMEKRELVLSIAYLAVSVCWGSVAVLTYHSARKAEAEALKRPAIGDTR